MSPAPLFLTAAILTVAFNGPTWAWVTFVALLACDLIMYWTDSHS